ncbi:hypothetical protein SAMN05444722_2451 [Rhodovulum sp. ES.010]|uniref:hypothetical protein n=1 Tax=Rhodovulum sp. ES.010 TaxID=1882821 RepID=UPI00092B24FE|nr:hypothetical protein [Rhodovulum sp. ES.010]SIO47755.1 hypothetical protein SAMN05444722_2451 [Rhodovulum sp. ES.010]
MGKVLIGLVIGLLLGGVSGFLMLGAGMGVGASTGLMTGVCAVVQAAQDEGLMTAEQVDRVLARVPATLGGEMPEGTEMAEGPTDCATFMDEMRAAASE